MKRHGIRLSRFVGLFSALWLAAMSMPASAINITFPYNLNYDSGASSLTNTTWTTGGATATHQTAQCWRGGCMKIVPAEADNTYAAAGQFFFPPTKKVHVRYLMYFGPDYVENLITRHKHILIHRGTQYSHDRGMTYIWHTGNGDFSMGACNNTDCRYEGNKTRPNGTESFLISQHLQEWIAFEAVFDTNTHTVRVYVTTRDGELNEHLLAEQQIHAVTADLDHWTYVSLIGAFIDLGTRPSPGMYWLMDELVISNTRIGPPQGFVQGNSEQPRPRAPAVTNVRVGG